jgi:hypothetical protein
MAPGEGFEAKVQSMNSGLLLIGRIAVFIPE